MYFNTHTRGIHFDLVVVSTNNYTRDSVNNVYNIYELPVYTIHRNRVTELLIIMASIEVFEERAL